MTDPVQRSSHAICNYEGTSYRADFWDGHGREYEDLAERIALRHLLPPTGRRLLEIGAGFGRLADLYAGYEQVILLDYAKSGLREAQARLGRSGRFLFVAADLYHVPLVPAICDTVVTVRVLHHVVDVPAALRSIATVLRPGGAYVLEYANKRNVKAIARYVLGRQRWSPFREEPVEFTDLNFDFHPRWMAHALANAGLQIEAGRAASYFRVNFLKRALPAGLLAGVDGLLQAPGAHWQPAPSVFWRCRNQAAPGVGPVPPAGAGAGVLFRCPQCGGQDWQETAESLACRRCGAVWAIENGIYDFKSPRHNNKLVNPGE